MTMNHRAHHRVDDDGHRTRSGARRSWRSSPPGRSRREAGAGTPGASPVPIPRQVRFLSVSAAADVLGMSQVTLYRAIQAGQFPAIRIRGRLVIPARALDEIEDAALATGTVVDPSRWTGGPDTRS